jgi:hypothetical protein
MKTFLSALVLAATASAANKYSFPTVDVKDVSDNKKVIAKGTGYTEWTKTDNQITWTMA